MQALSRELLHTLLRTDQTLTPPIRSVLADLADGKPLPDCPEKSAIEDRLIDVREAAKCLNVSRSKVYEERHLYAELTPVHFGGRVSYSFLAIQHLITRLKALKIAGLSKEGNLHVA